MRRALVLGSLLAAAIWVLAPAARVAAQPATGERPWQEEFHAVCGDTNASLSLDRDGLRAVVGRCDRLGERLASEQESTRKVYSRRLQLCRDFYLFMLEKKGSE